MKTTVELPAELLEHSRQLARREGTTLKALIEEGLRLALRSRTQRSQVHLRVRPFKGNGLTAEFEDAGWNRIREEIYRGRG